MFGFSHVQLSVATSSAWVMLSVFKFLFSAFQVLGGRLLILATISVRVSYFLCFEFLSASLMLRRAVSKFLFFSVWVPACRLWRREHCLRGFLPFFLCAGFWLSGPLVFWVILMCVGGLIP